ncbi:MAG TPA: 4-hydroxy-tetrahydrodipicolinate reductase [Alphaproteobacteria bacterium]|nr:4-hydroxy-tetrahydrodipicolinate reductase [Alphaproteobacteria bacterium]
MADFKVAIAGAGGRMGAANIRAVTAAEGIAVAAAFDRIGAPAIGRDAGEQAGIEPLGIPIVDHVEAALALAQGIIDFTAPAASVMLARKAAERGLVHIIGTTGFSAEDEAAIRQAAKAGARIVKAGNFSLGVNLLLGLVRKAAAELPNFDIEILEMHHNRKVDAPSGTALMLGEAAAAGRNVDLGTHAVRVRDGATGPRQEGTIGFATLRGGSVIGEHTVIFAGPAERVEFRHIADDRALFAQGAVRAALWARTQRPGLYSMADVLGLSA